jgi:hypothetical protein
MILGKLVRELIILFQNSHPNSHAMQWMNKKTYCPAHYCQIEQRGVLKPKGLSTCNTDQIKA